MDVFSLNIFSICFPRESEVREGKTFEAEGLKSIILKALFRIIIASEVHSNTFSLARGFSLTGAIEKGPAGIIY